MPRNNIGLDDDLKALDEIIDGLKEINDSLDKTSEKIADINKASEEEVKVTEEATEAKEKEAKTTEKVTKAKKEEAKAEKQLSGTIENTGKATQKTGKALEDTGEKGEKATNRINEGFKKSIDTINNSLGSLNAFTTSLVNIGQTVLGTVNKLNESWGKADQAAAQYTRSIGGSKASMDALRKSTIDFMESRSIGAKYNTSMEELIKLQNDYNNNIGRSISLTNEQKETFAAMKANFGDQTAIEFTTKLENFGLDPDEAGKRIGEMFSNASKSGVAFEKYSKNFLDNIKLAQNYNFTNGLKGLASMAKKATEVKLNMQQVASFAEKVSTLEGAMQTGANLSVLGGSFSRFGNPLQMLYEGLNDMEGLQDRVVNMFGDLGKWDYSKGQVDVSVFNKQRIKAASQSMGMDYGEVMQMINANARRNIVEGQLGNLNSGVRGDEEMRDLILNKAQVDSEGKAYVTVADEKKYLNQLSEKDKAGLRIENNSDSDNIREIAVNTRGYKDVMEGVYGKQKDVASASLNETMGIGKETKKISAAIGENPGMMKAIEGIDMVNTALGGITSILQKILGFMAIKGILGSGRGGVGGGKFSGVGSTRSWNGQKMRTLNNGTQQVWNGKRVGEGGKWVNAGFGTKAMNHFTRHGAAYGMAAGMAGMGLDYLADRGNMYQNTGAYTAMKAGSKALEWGGTGAAIGSMFGPLGTLVGGGIGLVGGAIYGAFTGNSASKERKEKERLAKLINDKFGVSINTDNYSVEEMTHMIHGIAGVRGTPLKQKMISNNDILPGFAKGGLTGDGNPSEIAGIVHKNEYVLNSSDVDKIKNGNVIEPLGNMMNQLGVSKNKIQENAQSSNVGAGSLEISINIGGTVKVEAENGDSKSIPANKLITNDVLNYIYEQLQTKFVGYAWNAENSRIHWKDSGHI